jgi:hypothetical protein
LSACGFADALLGLADRFVGHAADFVCGAAHLNSPDEVSNQTS